MYFYSDENYVLNNELGLNDIASLNKAERMLTTIRIARLRKKIFCREVSELFGDLNMLHPFRVENGRTEREFIYQLAKNAGYELDLTKLNKDEYMKAAILSVVDCSEMEKLMLSIIKEKN